MGKFIGPNNETWEITFADGVLKDTLDGDIAFVDNQKALDHAIDVIETKEAEGYQYFGNSQAAQIGKTNQVSQDQVRKVMKQLGPRNAVKGDPSGEISEIFQDPEDYEGGTLLLEGDVVIEGDWDPGDYALVLVDGNLSVEGLFYQFETEPFFIVTGNLKVENLILAGNLDVGGDLQVQNFAGFESGLGYTYVANTFKAKQCVLWDMCLQAKNVEVDELVDINGFLKAEQQRIGGDLAFPDVPIDRLVVSQLTGIPFN